MLKNQGFQTVITSKKKTFDLHLKELFKYRDLISLFVKRSFTATYKQTILGPLWAILQPLLTSGIFTLIFGNIAGLAPSGVPTFLFYFVATVFWQFFSGSLTNVSNTFRSNAHILGKVYFPRLVMPISSVLSQLISFAIQFGLFLIIWVIYMCTGANVVPNIYMLTVPLILIQLAVLGLGFGIIIASLTVKYRDLAFVIGFGMQLWMYATPVAYDISSIPSKIMPYYMLNPITPLINNVRCAFLGVGTFDVKYYLISAGVSIVILFIGLLLFSKVERNFMDTL